MLNVLGLVGLPAALAGLLLFPAMRAAVFKYLPAALCVILFVAFAGYLPIIENTPISETLTWVPALGLDLSLYMDGLALLFALLITGVGAVVAIYAAAYFDEDAERTRFAVLLMAFMSAMLGVVLAGNILTLFCAWELTSITSFFLIGFKGAKYEDARQSALRALVVTGAGGLALLAGLVIMGTAAGSYNLTDILAADLRAHPWYAAITVLVLIGAFTKSAQVPFHFWLPGAMAAPSPASAYLHAATMVKAGVYLVLRLYPALGNTDLWASLVMTVGLATFVWGAYVANKQRDMKGLLAYTTVSALGSLVALAGLPNSLGLKAALVGILAHGAYKAALFLITGAIEHTTGTRNLDKLGGLRQTMPGAFYVTLISALSMAGVPPLLGFIAKDYFLEAHFPEPLGTFWPFLAAFAGSALMVSAALTVLWDAFIRPAAPHDKHDDEHHHHHHSVPLLTAAPGVLAGVSVLLPFTLPWLVNPLISAALGKPTSLYLIPQHIEPLLVSLIALGVGWGLMQSRPYWANASAPRPSFGKGRRKSEPRFSLPAFTAANTYDGLMKTVDKTSKLALGLQGGRIRYYLIWILLVLSGLILLLLPGAGLDSVLTGLSIRLDGAKDLLKLGLLGLSLAATFTSIVVRQHLYAALSLGVSGYALGGVFLLEPAPDVALVQILVETIGTVMLMLMLGRMDAIKSSLRREAQSDVWGVSVAGRLRDIFISAVIGLAVALVALVVVVQRPDRAADEPISVWHLIHTYPEIKVTDAVGAIVTDFRGTDTLFEIMVFAVAALGVFTLLTPAYKDKVEALAKAAQKASDNEGADAEQSQPAKTAPHDSSVESPLTTSIARLVFMFSMMIALSHWLYGGGQPGDGFTAGVIASLAVALIYIIRGHDRTRKILPWVKPRSFVKAGLILALGNAMIYAVISGLPFLRVVDFGDAPAGLHFSSTLIFELAIGLTVFGAVTVITDTISHPPANEDSE